MSETVFVNSPGPGSSGGADSPDFNGTVSGTIVSVVITKSEPFGGLSNLVGVVRLNNERLFIVSSG